MTALLQTHRGFCLCCRMERANLAALNSTICRACLHHQNDDSGGWTLRDVQHRQLWTSQLDGATNAYLDELSTLEGEVIRLKGILKVAGISSVRTDPNAQALARIRELHTQGVRTAQTVAEILNDEGYEPPSQSRRWGGRMVNQLAGRTATSLVIEGAGKMVNA